MKKIKLYCSIKSCASLCTVFCAVELCRLLANGAVTPSCISSIQKQVNSVCEEKADANTQKVKDLQHIRTGEFSLLLISWDDNVYTWRKQDTEHTFFRFYELKRSMFDQHALTHTLVNSLYGFITKI